MVVSTLARLAADLHAEIDGAPVLIALVQLTEQRSGGVVVELAIEADPPWADTCTISVRIIQHASDIGIDPPSLAAWGALSPLQRFALLKLARDNHDNMNFIPAMREFGLSIEG